MMLTVKLNSLNTGLNKVDRSSKCYVELCKAEAKHQRHLITFLITTFCQ